MDTTSILMNIGDKLPKDMTLISVLKDKIDKLDDKARDDAYQKILSLKLKSPALVFWLGSVCFGMYGLGRFMIGDTKLGLDRLTLFIFPFILLAVVMNFDIDEILRTIMAFIVVIFFLAAQIWYIVDLFIVGKKLRRQNFDKVMQVIEGIGK